MQWWTVNQLTAQAGEASSFLMLWVFTLGVLVAAGARYLIFETGNRQGLTCPSVEECRAGICIESPDCTSATTTVSLMVVSGGGLVACGSLWLITSVSDVEGVADSLLGLWLLGVVLHVISATTLAICHKRAPRVATLARAVAYLSFVECLGCLVAWGAVAPINKWLFSAGVIFLGTYGWVAGMYHSLVYSGQCTEAHEPGEARDCFDFWTHSIAAGLLALSVGAATIGVRLQLEANWRAAAPVQPLAPPLLPPPPFPPFPPPTTPPSPPTSRPLRPGDCAIVGWDSKYNDFAILMLANVDLGAEKVFVTDRGTLSHESGALRDADESIMQLRTEPAPGWHSDLLPPPPPRGSARVDLTFELAEVARDWLAENPSDPTVGIVETPTGNVSSVSVQWHFANHIYFKPVPNDGRNRRIQPSTLLNGPAAAIPLTVSFPEAGSYRISLAMIEGCQYFDPSESSACRIARVNGQSQCSTTSSFRVCTEDPRSEPTNPSKTRRGWHRDCYLFSTQSSKNNNKNIHYFEAGPTTLYVAAAHVCTLASKLIFVPLFQYRYEWPPSLPPPPGPPASPPAQPTLPPASPATPPPPMSPAVCPSGWHLIGNGATCVALYPQSHRHGTCSSRCEAAGGSIACMSSREEDEAVKGLVRSARASRSSWWWLGPRLDGNSRAYAPRGCPSINYTGWDVADGQPSSTKNRCAVYAFGKRGWHSRTCSGKSARYGCICSMRANTSPPPFVTAGTVLSRYNFEGPALSLGSSEDEAKRGDSITVFTGSKEVPTPICALQVDSQVVAGVAVWDEQGDTAYKVRMDALRTPRLPIAAASNACMLDSPICSLPFPLASSTAGLPIRWVGRWSTPSTTRD